MNRTIIISSTALAVLAACSTPTTLRLEPELLQLEGAGAKGRIAATILDQDGKPIVDGPGLAWLPTNPEVAGLSQDGEVQAKSTGSSLYEVEVVGTEIRAQGKIEVRIPVAVGVSSDEVVLAPGQTSPDVTAQVFADTGAPITGFLAAWKVEDPAVAKLETLPDPNPARSRVRLTALEAGETYATASFKDLAADVHIVVTIPADDSAAATIAP
ncbi:MAG TPA: hypothetical protein VM285_13050 [Polyangia bacterium]|nr:hypothetical protein [Polyangia bacterium]